MMLAKFLTSELARSTAGDPRNRGRHRTSRRANRNQKRATLQRDPKPLVHPDMGRLYQQWVLDVRAALTDEARRSEGMDAIRSVVDQIVLTPENGKLAILINGDLAALLAAAGPAGTAEQVSLVAGDRCRHYLTTCGLRHEPKTGRKSLIAVAADYERSVSVSPSARAALLRRSSNAANEMRSPVSRCRYRQLASWTASPERSGCLRSNAWVSVDNSAVSSTRM